MLAGLSEEYLVSLLALTETFTGWVTLPSIKLSSTPRIVTVCAVFQLAAVKVSEEVTAVPSVGSGTMETVTFAVGCVARFTVKVAVAPASLVIIGEVGVRTKAAVSLSSLLLTDTSAA